jgi:hypothetical protein
MAGILASNADLSKEEGQAAVIRDLERHQLILDSLVNTGDSASNQSTIAGTNNQDTNVGSGIPDGFSIVTITVCVGGVSKSLDVIGRGPY